MSLFNSENKLKVVIAGTRTFSDYPMFERFCLNLFSRFQYEFELSRNDFEIVAGGARGADTFAITFAKKQGISNRVFMPEWSNLDVSIKKIKVDKQGKEYNALAGFQRNERMREYCKDGVLIAFWDGISPGTKEMIKESEKLGLRVFIVYYNGKPEKKRRSKKDEKNLE